MNPRSSAASWFGGGGELKEDQPERVEEELSSWFGGEEN
jgi:hypothetical protein